MNALTQIRNTQKASRQEIELGISDKSSWHSRFKHSAYVYAGGLPFELTEGDILAVFSQYGEIVDIHLVRDKKTGKSKGFAFLAYQDQRSTVLAVDNLSGAKVTGRTIRVEHVDNYKRKRAEVEGGQEEEEHLRGREGAGTRRDRQYDDDRPYTDKTTTTRQQQQQPPLTTTNSIADEPWAAGNSVFALLTEAREKEAASKQGKEKNDEDWDRGRRKRREEQHDDYDEGKDKKKRKKHKKRHDRSRSRSRG